MMAESSVRPTLTVLGGPLSGTRLVMEDAFDDVLIGSDPTCGFCLPLPGVSAVHARLWLDSGGLILFDAKSPYGLYINDERVEDRVFVHNGDVIWLGSPGTDDAVMIQCRIPPGVGAALAAAVPKTQATPPEDDEDADDEAIAAAAAADDGGEAGEVLEPSMPPAEAGESEAALAEPMAEDAEEEAPTEAEAAVEASAIAEADEVASEPAEAVAVEAAAVDAEAEDVVEAEGVAVVEPEPDEAVVTEAEVEAEPEAVLVEAEASTDGVDDRTRPLEIYRGGGEPPATVSPQEFLIEESAEAVTAPPSGEDEGFLMRDPEEFREDAQTVMRPASERPPAGFEDEVNEASATVLTPARAAAAPAPPRSAEPEATAYIPAPPAPTPMPPPAPVAAAPAPRPASPPPAARPATPTPPPAAARPAPRPASAPRPTPPRSSAPAGRPAKASGGGGKGAILGIGAAVAAVALGAGGYFAYQRFATPAPTPAPTPPPAAVVTTPPPPVPTPTLAAEAAATPEPTQLPVEEAVTIVPSPRASAAPTPSAKATPPPVRPTTAPPAAATPAPLDPAAQRAAQVAGLLAQAEGAAAAQNHEQASSLFEEVLKLDPGNARATAGRQSAVAARDVARRSFVPGRTVVRTEKAGGGGLAGFDSSGVSVQKAPDFQGRIEFTMSPARIKAGDSYSLRTFVVNDGKKAIKISGLTVLTTLNGTRSGGPANPLARDIEPQQRALVDERTGTWPDGANSWTSEVTVTAKGDSLRNTLTWK